MGFTAVCMEGFFLVAFPIPGFCAEQETPLDHMSTVKIESVHFDLKFFSLTLFRFGNIQIWLFGLYFVNYLNF